MGMRHQAFIIARVVPHGETEARYRCISAYYLSWCYGRIPLKATSRFLNLLKQKDNAEIVREEIRAVQGKYGRWNQQPWMPRIPCPYTTFLLASAFLLDIEDPKNVYAAGWSFMDSAQNADMGSHDEGIDEGLTVIDVTDVGNPSYCFINYHSPITAKKYVRGYYPIPTREALDDEGEKEWEDDVLRIIEALDGVPLVTLKMLAEAWPKKYRKMLQESLAETAETGKPSADDKPNIFPALADLVIKAAVDHSLAIGDTRAIEDFTWMPNKLPLIKAALRSHDPFPEAGLSLLAKIIDEEAVKGVIDLSEFLLSSEQIIQLVSHREGIEVLKLSHNANVVIDTVRQVLTHIPNLRRLVLFGTSVSDDDLEELLLDSPTLFYRLESLVHPLFLTLNDDSYPNAFSLIAQQSYKGFGVASLPVFTPAQVIQCLGDYLAPYAANKGKEMESCSFMPQPVMSAEYRGPDRKWGERIVPVFAQVSLRALKGEGWFFAVVLSSYGVEGNAYAFVKADGAALKAHEQRAKKVREEAEREEAEKKRAEKEKAEQEQAERETVAEKAGSTEPNDDAGEVLTKVVDTVATDTPAGEGSSASPKPVARPPALYQLYGLYGFLGEMELEGRPAPPPSEVERLDAMLEKLPNMRVMTYAEVVKFANDSWKYTPRLANRAY